MWVLALLFCMPVRSVSARLLARITHEGSALHQTLTFTVRLTVSLLMLVLSVALLVGATNNAFIYTRF
jgi:alginate O-acetyltransferase complex protein AlgI